MRSEFFFFFLLSRPSLIADKSKLSARVTQESDLAGERSTNATHTHERREIGGNHHPVGSRQVSVSIFAS